MKRTLFPIVFTLLTILTLLPTVFAQAIIPPWHIATLEGHTDEVTSLKFSPDYATLASGSADGTVRLWETATGKHLATLEGHAWSITSLAFSADSRTLTSAAHTEVWVWDVASGRRKAAFDEHTDKVTAVALSANGSVLASSSNDRTVRVWDLTTGTNKAKLEHSGQVASVALSPNGKTVASAVGDSVYLWDVVSGQEKIEIRTDRVYSLAFSPNGRTLVSGEYYSWFKHGLVKLWDVASGEKKVTFTHSRNSTRVTSVIFSADGRTIVSGGRDKTVKLWDVTSKKRKATFATPSEVWSIAPSSDGGTLASASDNWSVSLWDVASGQEKIEIRTDRVYSLAFSPNGRTLVSGEYYSWFKHGLVKLWDVASGEKKVTFTHSRNSTRVTSVIFSADGRTIVSGSTDRTVALWDVASKERKATFEGHAGRVRSVAISPDSRTVASGSEDWTLRLWDVATNQERAKLEGHTDWVNTVAFNPSGGTLVSGSSDGTVRVWNATTGSPRTTFEAHVGTVEHVVFSPDGTMLASLSAEEIKLWNTTTWQRITTFPEPANNLTSVAFCLDGRALAIGSEWNVRVWDFAKGVIKMTIPRRSTSLAFGDGSRTLAIGYSDTVYLWNLAPPKWELSSSGAGGVGTTPSTDSADVSPTAQKPDLVVDSVRIEPASDPGKLYLYATLRNQGTAPSTTTTLRYYRSTNDPISPSDTRLGSGKRDPLPPNGTVTRRLLLTAPTSPGTYYYGACVDSIPDESNTDNNCSAAVSYTVGAEGTGLAVSDDIISEVAYGPDSTYFVLTAQFPKLIGIADTDVVYGRCTIKIDLPGVPDTPVDNPNSNDQRLDNPGYFMVPLLTPRQRIVENEDELIAGLVVEGIGLIPLVGDLVGIQHEISRADLHLIETLKSTADPQIRLTNSKFAKIQPEQRGAKQRAQEAVGHPKKEELRFLFLLNGRVPTINIAIEQVYYLASDFGFTPVPEYTATYAGTLKLENIAMAAPSAQPMSLTNYPAFQSLSPEAQAYLLQHFGASMGIETWQLPEQTSLLPNYPNPFNPETWIPYQLAESADVTVKIYDIHGRVVRNLDLGHQRAGIYHTRSRAAYWDGRNAQGEPVASGVYFYTLKAGDFSATRKMLIRK